MMNNNWLKSVYSDGSKWFVSNPLPKKGEKITADLIAFKRPGTGIAPAKINEVIGKTALVDISKDTLIDFDMID